jgi:hypothetical protein
MLLDFLAVFTIVPSQGEISADCSSLEWCLVFSTGFSLESCFIFNIEPVKM